MRVPCVRECNGMLVNIDGLLFRLVNVPLSVKELLHVSLQFFSRLADHAVCDAHVVKGKMTLRGTKHLHFCSPCIPGLQLDGN